MLARPRVRQSLLLRSCRCRPCGGTKDKPRRLDPVRNGGLSCPLFGGCKQMARLMRSGYRMPVAAPPIESAEQFLGAKSQPRELVRALGRCIAADPVAIDDIDLAAVEACGGFRVHFAMWEADSARDVARDVCIAGTGVDHHDVGKGGLEIDKQIP